MEPGRGVPVKGVSIHNRLAPVGNGVSRFFVYRHMLSILVAFILGENMVRKPTHVELTKPEDAFFYARDVVKGRFLKGEPVILRDSAWAIEYAIDILGKRWPELERLLLARKSIKSAHHCSWYAMSVVKGRWPEAEKKMALNPSASFAYAMDVIKGRWPPGEAAISTSPLLSSRYALEVVKGRFPEGEPAISKSPVQARHYLRRFPAAKDEWAMNGLIDWLDT